MSNILELTDNNIDDILTHDELIVVDCWAEWCGPCIAFGPTFKLASTKFPDVIFAKIDVDTQDCQNITRKYNIRSIPTTLFIKDGELIDTSIGLMLQGDLFKKIVENR